MLDRDAFSIPPGPLSLTMAGLAPFAGCAAAVCVFAVQDGTAAIQAAGALLLYAAVILSFLGGVRWGAELVTEILAGPRGGELPLSVLGALIGWAAAVGWFFWTPAPEWLLLMAVALALQWMWDLAPGRGMPAWYAGLRSLASAGSVASMILAWGALRLLL